MSIEVKSTDLLSARLKSALTNLASKYYHSGTVEVYAASSTDTRTSVYYPDNPDYLPLILHSVGDEVEGVGRKFGDDTDPKIVALKNDLVRGATNRRYKSKSSAGLDRRKFNGLGLPESTVIKSISKATAKTAQVTVTHAVTPTQIHYLVATITLLSEGDDYNHRIRAESPEELVIKLGDFIGKPYNFPIYQYLKRDSGNFTVNSQKLADLLVKLDIS